MKKFIAGFIAIVLLTFTQGCGKQKPPAPEEACHFQQNSYLQRVSWAKRLPVQMYVDSSLSVDQVQAFVKAMTAWNETLKAKYNIPMTFQFMGVLSGDVGTKEDRKNVVSITTNWVGRFVEQAETLVRWSGDAIYEADIKINGLKALSTSDIPEFDKLDLAALFVHELGHVLGLLHIDDGHYSAMASSLELGNVERRKIGEEELDALKCEY